MDKSHLRQSLLAARRALSAGQRLAFGAQICATVISQPEWASARVIGCYLALPEEVPTRDIIVTALREKKRVAVPKTDLCARRITFHALSDLSGLAPGPLGILEPQANEVPAARLELLLVPGVGFDVKGHRLGFGKGLFDRFLSTTQAMTFGLAFDLQLVAALPFGPQDRPVQRIITEKRVVRP